MQGSSGMSSTSSSTINNPLGPYTSPFFVWVWDANSVITVVMLGFAMLLLAIAPFNKFTDKRGRLSADVEHTLGLNYFPMMDSTVAWFVMESPTTWLAWIFYFVLGGSAQEGWRWPVNRFEAAPLVMFCLFQLHYLQRVCLYPFLLRDTAKDTSLYVVLLSFSFTTVISYIVMNFISDVGYYPAAWLYDPRFLIGTLVYLYGYFVNRRCDWILRELRDDHRKKSVENELEYEGFVTSTGKMYGVPHGSWFEYVSAGNYAGELVEWLGFAMLTWSLQGLAFFLCCCGYLIPRALQYHRWYAEHFPHYPRTRKAIIPFCL